MDKKSRKYNHDFVNQLKIISNDDSLKFMSAFIIHFFLLLESSNKLYNILDFSSWFIQIIKLSKF